MSLILDALRKSEHGRHGAADSVLPLIVTPRAGRVRKKRVATLPILIMLLVVTATVVIFLYRETIFPPRSVNQTPPIPAVSKPQMTQQIQQQTQPQDRAETPVKEVQQALPPDVEPSQSTAQLKSKKPPLAKPEMALPDAAVTDQPKVVKRNLPQKSESVVALEAEAKPAPKAIAKPKPEPVKRDAIPAALSTFPADFIRKVQPLHLDFHVYSPDISRRMVYINNREYEEGDRLKNSLKVVRIVPQGAVMQWDQQSFLLTAQD
ncbi:MAG: general secretion pathway protein GspB [Pseudomonadota bacterium]|nr:general secretion pathway protein GspB [Pseudomonadota bacterium]